MSRQPSRRPARPLARQAFRALLVGHSVTILGFWLFFTTLFTQATFRLDATAGQLALLTALLTFPLVALAPFTGLLVDRLGAHGCLRVSYAAAGATVAAGAVAADTIPELYLLGAAMSVISALLRPAVFGLMSRVVPGEEVSAAQGLVIAGQEAGLVLGPLLTAAAFAKGAGPTVTYAASAAGYLAGLALVGRVPRLPRPDRPVLAGLRDRVAELAAGARSVRRDPPRLVVAACILALFAFVGVLLAVQPVFLRDELGADRHALSVVFAVDGIGSCGAALWASRRRAPRHPIAHLGGTLALLGLVVLGWSRAPSLALALPMNLLIGVCFGLFVVRAMAVLQGRTPVPVAGRVIASVTVGQQVAQGTVALLAGELAARHVRASLAATGAMLLAVGALTWTTQRAKATPPPPPGSPQAGPFPVPDGGLLGTLDPAGLTGPAGLPAPDPVGTGAGPPSAGRPGRPAVRSPGR